MTEQENTTRTSVGHAEPPHIEHPARTLTLIAMAIALLIAGGFGLRHVQMQPGTLPAPVQGR